MHKIDKFLARLTAEQRKKILEVLVRIDARELTGLDIRKLQGVPDVYRVRVGRVRIVFYMNDAETRIINIGNRDEQIYRDI